MIDKTGYVALVALHLAVLCGFQASAAEKSFADFPFIVHCENSGSDRAYYLAKIDPDGVAIYISPDNLAGTITLHGPAEPVGGEWAGNCAGKTLKQLRADGQAFDLR